MVSEQIGFQIKYADLYLRTQVWGYVNKSLWPLSQLVSKCLAKGE